MPLTIVARITAVPGKEDVVRSALKNLVEPTRAEAGCIQYDLHVDNSDPAVFLFFEIWESRPLWQDHLNSAHIQANRTVTEGAIDSVVLNEMTHIA